MARGGGVGGGGGMGNRKMRRAMGRMMAGAGANAEPVPDVLEVVIRTERSETILPKPTVMKMEAGGRTSFTVSGADVEEREIEAPAFRDEDIDLVCQQTGVGRDRAVEVLGETGGDMAQAIMRLSSG